MTLDREKVDLILAKNQLTVSALASDYGVSRNRMNVILNSKKITPACVSRLADTLGVDVTEIIEFK